MSQISSKTSGKVHIHILHDDTLQVDAIENMKSVSKMLKQNISFYDVSKEKEYVRMKNGTLYRLFLPRLCKQLKRVIYLDVDVLVVGDLRQLWEIDLGSNAIGAVLDSPQTRDVVSVQSRYFDKKIDNESYFNAGVLLMNLERIRRDSFELPQEYLAFFNKYPHALLLDQDFLNYKYQGRYTILLSMFNFIPDDVDFLDDSTLDKQIVIHFAGFYKPWNCRNPFVLKTFFQNMAISFPEEVRVDEISTCMSSLPHVYCEKTGLILFDDSMKRLSVKAILFSLKSLLKEVYKVDFVRYFCYIVTIIKMTYLYNIYYRYFCR